MKLQITLNQFNALTLLEKLEMFGSKFFTAKQCKVLKSIVEFDTTDADEISEYAQMSRRSLGSVINGLNRKHDLIERDEGWCNDVYYHLDSDQVASIICIDELIEMNAVELIEEVEAPVEAAEETPAHSLTCQVNLWDLVKDCPTISTRQINKMGYKTAQGTRWDKESLELLKNLVLHDNVEAFCTCKEITEEIEETPVEASEENIIEKAQCIAAVNDQPLIQLESSLDSSVIGFTFNQNQEVVLIYSYEAIINSLAAGLDETEAIEHFNHNLNTDKIIVSYT